MAHSASTGTAPEQQIPNYALRAAVVEQQARQLFAISRISGKLACIGTGIEHTKGNEPLSDGSDNVYFDIGIMSDAGRLFQRHVSVNDIDDTRLSRSLHRRFAMPTRTDSGSYIRPSRRVPVFPAGYDLSAMARGEYTARRVPGVDRFRATDRLYVGGEPDAVLGGISSEGGLHVFTESFYRRDLDEIATNLGRIETVLASLSVTQVAGMPTGYGQN